MKLVISGQHQHEADFICAGGAKRVRPLAAKRLRRSVGVRRRRRHRARQDSGATGRRQTASEGKEVHSDATNGQGQ